LRTYQWVLQQKRLGVDEFSGWLCAFLEMAPQSQLPSTADYDIVMQWLVDRDMLAAAMSLIAS